MRQLQPWQHINFDLESSSFLSVMLDYSKLPYKLKKDASLWCVSVRDYVTEEAVLLVPKELLNEEAPTMVVEEYGEEPVMEPQINSEDGSHVMVPTGEIISTLKCTTFYSQHGVLMGTTYEKGYEEEKRSSYQSYKKPLLEGVKYNSITKRELSYDMLKKIFANATEISGHNIVNFDLPTLQLFGMIDYQIGYPVSLNSPAKSSKLFGRDIKVIDTLIQSKLLNPDLQDSFGRHSLEAYGLRLGFPKMDFNEFSQWSWKMGYYCDNDTLVGIKLVKHLEEQLDGWDWDLAYSVEIKCVDLTVGQEHFGFHFDKDLAEWCLKDLDVKLEERASLVEPSLPPKPLNKGEQAFFTPPTKQILKNGSPNSFIQKFADKHGSTIEKRERKDDEGAFDYFFIYKEKEFQIPFHEPLETSLPTKIKDHDPVKGYLLQLGWEPTEWKERDLTKSSLKQVLTYDKAIKTIKKYAEDSQKSPYLKHRLEFLGIKKAENLEKELLKKHAKNPQKPLKVLTSPQLRVGAQKELCENLLKIGKDAEFVNSIVEWHTYTHRKNSIAGGDTDEDGTPSKGFLSFLREDGRVATPADTLGAASFRYTHKNICNIARGSSIYGEFMRSLFGAGPGLFQFGFDFASLEARVQAHYIYKYLGGPELGVALLAEKPNDIHCYSEDTEILTEEGWRTFDNLGKDIKVAQWTTENKVEFVKPLGYVWQKYKGEMVSLDSNNLSLLVTPNHRVVYKNVKSGYKEALASDFIKNSITCNTRIPLSGMTTSVKPSIGFDLCKLIVATQADGCLLKDCSGINFEFKKERKVLRLLSILDSVSATYSVTEDSKRGTTKVYIKASALTKEIRSYLTSNKSLSKKLLTLSKEDLEIILEEVQYWDGTAKNSNVILDTTSEETVDTLQAISHLLNKKATKNSYNKITKYGKTLLYRLTVSLKAKPFAGVLTTSPSIVSYEGYIGCVSVPSTYVVIRRNGKVSISGNTLNAKKLGISRDNAKSITYALLYGAAAAKLQKMLGLTPEEAEKMFNDYWDAVPPLKKLRDDLVNYWEKVDRDHIIGIDGRKLRARSPHSLINLLFQSAGAILAKWSVVRIAELLEEQNLLGNPFINTKDEVKVWQMIVYHDEVQYACHPSLINNVSFFNEDVQKQFEESKRVWKENGAKKEDKPKNPFEEAANQFIENNKTDDPLEQFSDVGHTDKGIYYVTTPNTISRTVLKAIDDTVQYHELTVPLGIAWITGLNWKMCH